MIIRQCEKIKLGVLMPSIHIGGGENATHFAIEHSDHKLYVWQLVLVTDPYVTWDYLWQYAEIVPVYFEDYCYHLGQKTPMTLSEALDILRECDGVISWELDDVRSKMFNSFPGIKIHWIFRHDQNHRKQVHNNHILLTCSDSCISDFGDIGNRKVTVIPSHVDLARCVARRSRQEIRDEWGVDDRLVVGYLGRMDRNKNIPAIARAVAKQPDMIAICYGARSWDSRVVEQEIQQIAGENLRWFDAIIQVGNALRGFDVMILPSYSEVFSLSLLEAWATEVPVVCTNVGEVPALQKQYGRLCSLIDPSASGEEIREAIHRAISDWEAVERAQQMVMAHYTPEIVAQQWNSFFEEVFVRP